MRAAVLSVLVLAGCASSSTSFHYAVVNADSVVARDATVASKRLVEIRQAAGCDFVWFDHGNAEYVVTDPVQVGLANRAIEPVRRIYRVMQRSTVTGVSVISWNHDSTLEHRLSRAAKKIDQQMTLLLEIWLRHGIARKLRRPLRCGRDDGVLHLVRNEM